MMPRASTSRDYVNGLASAQLANYARQPAELISHYNREVSALDGYRGRQLLELLQNADDAGVGSSTGCALHIDLSRERLVVANAGSPFSPKGLTSLVISDCSPKQLDRNRFIGCKGLGFRSILAWTDRPLISSGTFDVVFDRARAVEIVRGLADENPLVADAVQSFRDATGRWPAAVMRFPADPDVEDRWLLEARLWRAGGYDTVIVMPLPGGDRGDEAHREILEQLTSLPANALLFCQHLTRVEIAGDVTRRWELLRESHGHGHATVVLQQDGIDELWEVYRRDGRISVDAADTTAGGWIDYEVAVAVPKDVKPNPEGTLHVFFPTRERMPCAVVMHATLETTPDRNRLVNHASNREVLKHLAAHVADVVERQAGPAEPRRALQLLAGAELADPELVELGFFSALVSECGARRIFPRLDQSLAAADGVYQAPHGVWLEQVTPEWFPELMPVGPDDPLRPLVSVFNLRWFGEASIRKRLQAYLLSVVPSRAGEVVGALLASGELASVSAGGLLVGTDGHLVVDGECFFNPVGELSALPDWASSIKFVDDEFQRGLMVGSKSLGLRHLASDLSRCGASVDEYRFDTVARALINEVERGLTDDDPLRLERWRGLLRWILRASGGSHEVLPKLAIWVVTAGGALRRATTCYLGSAYPRGQVVWRLYGPFGDDEFVGPPDLCGLEGALLEDAENFLLSIGVSAAPRLEPFRSDTEYERFRRTVVAQMSFPRSVRDRMCSSVEEMSAWCWSYVIDGLRLPDRWFRLLAEGDCRAVVAYLLSSGAALLASENDPQGRFLGKVESERMHWHDPSIPIPNPVLHSLRETAWVAVAGGERRRPSEIMLSSQGVRVLRGVYTRHAIDTRDPLVAAHGGREAVDALLARLGAVSSIETLSGPALYDLLLSLPERDPRGEVAPGIYRTLIESSVSVDESAQRDAFLRSGRMWGGHRGVHAYLPVTQLRYNSSLTVAKSVEAHIPLVAIPHRMNTRLIKGLFGIDSLTSEEVRLELQADGTEYDPGSEDANLHLGIALPYIYALRLARNLDDDGREAGLLREAVLRVCVRAHVTAVLPGGGSVVIVLAQPGERIVVDSTLIAVGEYRTGGDRSLTFWLGVAELVADLLGRDVADEVGGVLRCLTPSEMLEVVRVRLGEGADAKLAAARARFADAAVESDEPAIYQIPAPRPAATAGSPESAAPGGRVPTDRDASAPAAISTDAEAPVATGSTARTFAEVEGPASKPPKRRRLVVVGSAGGGGGGRGPLATEKITFEIVEAFELTEGRFIVPVSHLHGAEAFGCDLLSVGSPEVRDAAIRAQSISEADILRRIEVKGRSSRTAEVELSDNEYREAQRHGAHYWLYRVYVHPNRESHYEIALLSDPLNSLAVRRVTRFDLAQGSGARWVTMVETLAVETTPDPSEPGSGVGATDSDGA